MVVEIRWGVLAVSLYVTTAGKAGGTVGREMRGGLLMFYLLGK